MLFSFFCIAEKSEASGSMANIPSSAASLLNPFSSPLGLPNPADMGAAAAAAGMFPLLYPGMGGFLPPGMGMPMLPPGMMPGLLYPMFVVDSSLNMKAVLILLIRKGKHAHFASLKAALQNDAAKVSSEWSLRYAATAAALTTRVK